MKRNLFLTFKKQSMELVTFENQSEQSTQENTTLVITKKKRKPGAGRKSIYTSKSVSFSASIPTDAIGELKEFVNNLKNKYRK
jgi:hypothetical protein